MQPRANAVEVEVDDRVVGDTEEPVYTSFNISSKVREPCQVTVRLNSIPAIMEVDTCAAVSVISEETYRALWNVDSRPPIFTSSKILNHTLVAEL